MIFDTDILIWIERNRGSAALLVDSSEQRFISTQTYLELIQYAANKDHITKSKGYLKDLGFKVLPITEDISHRAMVYIEEYSLSHGLGAGDALIAATAVEHGLPLATGNEKHFRAIKDLKLKVFKPG
jgi:predicted nucleic acid-binding protein